MKYTVLFFALLLLVFIFFAPVTKAVAQVTDKQLFQQKNGFPPEDSMIVMTTLEDAKRHGCWATMYDKINFEGRELVLVNGQMFSNLRFPLINKWSGSIHSAVVGKKAFLVLFKKENFREKDLVLGPDEAIPEIRQAPIFGTTKSVKLVCINE